MSTRFRLALLIYGMVNAVIFGAGAITVLSLPSLQEEWPILLPVVVVASLVLAAPLAWAIAPRMRSRFGRKR